MSPLMVPDLAFSADPASDEVCAVYELTLYCEELTAGTYRFLDRGGAWPENTDAYRELLSDCPCYEFEVCDPEDTPDSEPSIPDGCYVTAGDVLIEPLEVIVGGSVAVYDQIFEEYRMAEVDGYGLYEPWRVACFLPRITYTEDFSFELNDPDTTATKVTVYASDFAVISSAAVNSYEAQPDLAAGIYYVVITLHRNGYVADVGEREDYTSQCGFMLIVE